MKATAYSLSALMIVGLIALLGLMVTAKPSYIIVPNQTGFDEEINDTLFTCGQHDSTSFWFKGKHYVLNF